MIQILANGSKWAGEPPDIIEDLLFRLQNHTLDPMFEVYGNFIIENPRLAKSVIERDGTTEIVGGELMFPGINVYHFFGNFAFIGAVFSLYTDELDVVYSLTKAIRQNQMTDQYVAYRQIRRNGVSKNG
jgi:hypothetical protein